MPTQKNMFGGWFIFAVVLVLVALAYFFWDDLIATLKSLGPN